MKLLRLIPLLALSVALTFTVDVAGRCQAEVSFGVGVCACTVKARIDAGWAQSSVLQHYYARSVQPSAESVAEVAAVLSGKTACGDEYYLFSSSDVRWLGLDVDDAVVTVCRGKACVYGYGKGALNQ